MLTIINAIIPIFLLIGLGVVIKILQNTKKTWLQKLFTKVHHKEDKWSKSLNMFVLYVALPALIVHSLSNTKINEIIGQDIVLINVILLSSALLLAWAYTKIFHVHKDIANTYIMCMMFGNVAYIGFPFMAAILPGTEGSVSVLVGLHVAIAFTLGIFILEHSRYKHVHYKKILKRIATNPLLIAVVIGFVFMLSGYEIPQVINRALQMLASSASPVILVAIGLFIAQRVKWDKTLMHAAIISSIKLIVLPLVLIAVAYHKELANSLDVSILEAAMPVALTNFALAEIYPMDKKLVAKSIIVSTILAIFTLSALAVIVV